MYRRYTPWFTDVLRAITSGDIGKNIVSSKMLDMAHALQALETRLPPEMVEWARLNR